MSNTYNGYQNGTVQHKREEYMFKDWEDNLKKKYPSEVEAATSILLVVFFLICWLA
jgi:hypothetical protein